MTWIDRLAHMLLIHLAEHHHIHSATPCRYIRDEVDIFTDFLVYETWQEGNHRVRCPMIDCDWNRNFSINFDVKIEEEEE